jgi:hypothetical protein
LVGGPGGAGRFWHRMGGHADSGETGNRLDLDQSRPEATDEPWPMRLQTDWVTIVSYLWVIALIGAMIAFVLIT